MNVRHIVSTTTMIQILIKIITSQNSIRKHFTNIFGENSNVLKLIFIVKLNGFRTQNSTVDVAYRTLYIQGIFIIFITQSSVISACHDQMKRTLCHVGTATSTMVIIRNGRVLFSFSFASIVYFYLAYYIKLSIIIIHGFTKKQHLLPTIGHIWHRFQFGAPMNYTQFWNPNVDNTRQKPFGP